MDRKGKWVCHGAIDRIWNECEISHSLDSVANEFRSSVRPKLKQKIMKPNRLASGLWNTVKRIGLSRSHFLLFCLFYISFNSVERK